MDVGHRETDTITTFKPKLEYKEPIIFEPCHPLYLPIEQGKFVELGGFGKGRK
jgi:hypothetical protein